MAETGYPYDADFLKKAIDRFPSARILVVGDIIMDEFIWGRVSRISPEAPVPVVNVTRQTTLLGGAANVIHNMASLGAAPILCGVIGADRRGEEIVEKVRALGLDTGGIVMEPDRPTSIKTRVVAHGQQVVRFDRESRREILPGSTEKLLQFIEEKLPSIDAVVVSDYGKGVISTPLMKGLRDRVRAVSERSIVTAVDPKTGNFEYYRGVDVITPNHHEAGAFCGFEITDRESLVRAGHRMLERLECRSVLITQGKRGVTLFENGGDITHIPTFAKKVFDVTGAGDTVIATFSLGLGSGLDLRSAAVLSNFAAGLVVAEVGTSAVTAAELKKSLGDGSPVPE